MSTTERLDQEIRSLVTELIDSAPTAPSQAELEDLQDGQLQAKVGLPRSGSRVRLAAIGAIAAGALAVALLAAFLPPTSKEFPVAEAAQLRLIAENTAQQPVPSIGPNQWLRTQQTASVTLRVMHQVPTIDPLSGGPAQASEPVPGATATSRVSSTEWSNNFGQACVSDSFGQLSFASPSDQAAWTAAGLTAAPTGMPIISCPNEITANGVNGFANGIGAVDVSGLPSDPSRLATELEHGTTGIPGLATAGNSTDSDQGFRAAVELLIGPITGKAASFDAEIYRALALMPGIRKLGQVTTHTGATGFGFTATSSGVPATIVIDPATGGLLEVDNFPLRSLSMEYVFGELETAFTSGNLVLAQRGEEVVFSMQWSDTTGPETVIETSELPPGVDPPARPVAVIRATAKPGLPGLTNVPFAQTQKLDDPLNNIEQQLTGQFGAPGDGISLGLTDRGYVMVLGFSGARSQVIAWVSALRSSGLFVSVDVNWGGG